MKVRRAMSFRPKKSLENDKNDGFEGGLMVDSFSQTREYGLGGFCLGAGGRQADDWIRQGQIGASCCFRGCMVKPRLEKNCEPVPRKGSCAALLP